MTKPNFMNGVPELLILRLIEKREMYGYELVQAIRTETKDAISIGEGVVYPVLHALERKGALKSRRKPVNGRTRVYYSVTRTGVKRLIGLTNQWNRIFDAVGHLAKGARHASTI